MNFSYEEIYSLYGQYDTFVTLEFHHNSEPFRMFKPTLMGTFKYTLDDREKLQAIIASDNIPRTNQPIKFVPSSLENLTNEQVEILDKKGIQNANIACISSFNWPRENRFIINGKKDIPNTLEIKFDSSDWDSAIYKLGFYNSRLLSGHKLIPEEEFEYFGLQLFYNPDQFNGELKKKLIDESTSKIKEPIRYYQLMTKFLKSDLTKGEDAEFKEITSRRTKIKLDILVEEIKSSTEKLKDIAVKHKDTLYTLINICSQFEDNVLLPYDIPIWWDFERFLHIYIRHVKETKVGERFTEKTIFQYKFRDIKRIVKTVIERVYDEIIQHFKEKPLKNFRRMGTRSIYYDGTYYRIEIEPNGRLITFHPYNDNENPTDLASEKQ
jgi:hypothetical protein